jgi:dolichol-phosphate mannosyltransferase
MENGGRARPDGKRLTIICPVFNEAAVIPLFYTRIAPVIAELESRGYDVGLLFLNNASSDGTLDAILELRRASRKISVISLSANVGYQRSLECGLRNAIGDIFVFIDVDCEDPPELLAEFVTAYESGYDIVYGERVDREEPTVLKLFRKAFYRVLRALADDDVILDMAEFSLITSEVRDAIARDQTSFPFIRASIGRVGFRRNGIPYKRERRIAGTSHYNVLGMIKFAVAGVLSSSTWLLRVLAYGLPLWLLAVVVVSVLELLHHRAWYAPVLAVLVCTYVGPALASIAIYVARIHKNTLGRPNYYIDRRTTYFDDAIEPAESESVAVATRDG